MALPSPLLLALIVSQPPGIETSAASEPESVHQWHASAQIGVGGLDDLAAGVGIARLGYSGDLGHLTLAAPLWVRFEDSLGELGSDAVNGEAGSLRRAGWVNDWEDPESWAAIVERLDLSFAGRTVELELGPRRQESLGYGTLVYDLQGYLDPTLRRTGARFDLHLDTVSVEAVADSVVEPHVVGLHVAVAPLRWLGVDDLARFRVSTSAALDPLAPDGRGGTTVMGGGDLTAGYIVWRGEQTALETYLAGALLSHPSVGAHVGVRFEVAGRPGEPESDALVLALEGLATGEGYLPGYFDVAYEAERIAVDARRGRPKIAFRPREGWGVRGRADVRFGRATFGASAQSAFRGELSTTTYLKIDHDRLSAAVFLVKRDMDRPEDLWDFTRGTLFTAEAAGRIYEGLFAFAGVHHGWRDDRAGGLVVATDWMVGAGYAVDGTFTR